MPCLSSFARYLLLGSTYFSFDLLQYMAEELFFTVLEKGRCKPTRLRIIQKGNKK